MEPTSSAQPADSLGSLPRSLFLGVPGQRTATQTPVEPSALPLLDAVELNRLAVELASQGRVQELLAAVAEIMARLEAELFRLLGPMEPPPAAGWTLPPARGGESTLPPVRELAEALGSALKALARQAPEEAAKLLAQVQTRAQAFPASTQLLVTRAGALLEPAAAQLLAALIQPPPPGQSPPPIPTFLFPAILDPSGLPPLLKLAGDIADAIRTGEIQLGPSQGHGGATPAGDTMDGIFTGSQSPGTSLLSPVSTGTRASQAIDSAALLSSIDLSVGVDVVSISDSGRGIATGLSVDVLVRANQILSGALGSENLLQLAETQIQTGVQFTQRQSGAGNSPLDRLVGDLGQRLFDLRDSDPEGFDKLIGLLRVLAKLNPGKFDSVLAEVESGLRDIMAAQQAPIQAAVASPAAALQQANAAGNAGGAGQSFTITIDVRIDQRVDAVIADLRNQGLDASALQSESSTQIQVTVRIGSDGQVQKGDPLIIDLQGDGVDLTDRSTAFDINADGTVDQSAFVRGDDALLFVDQNGDGQLTDGKELFGEQEGDADGFAKLERFDDNRDGVIDAKDAIFDKLRLVYDKNQDSLTQLNEVALLREAGIDSISLSRRSTARTDAYGNDIVSRAEVTRTDGTRTGVYEANLTYQRIV